MLQSWKKPAAGCLALAGLLAAAFAARPLQADMATGADAASLDEGTAAVREWEALAARDDPDALFNLAQAYWRGRGVPADMARAEALCARAAALGHAQAANAYGLLLFEAGQREAAIPHLRGAARRGDPRARYLLGIAHFNGDFVEVDWPRAYALMMLADAAGLPQAAAALAEMNRTVPTAQRQQASTLAQQLRAGSEEAWSPEPAAPGGPWKVQLGAFSVASNADALRANLEGRDELAGARLLTVPAGRLTLLQAAGFPSRQAASAACAALRRSGHDCLVVER